jgi:hypothetical protein
MVPLARSKATRSVKVPPISRATINVTRLTRAKSEISWR